MKKISFALVFACILFALSGFMNPDEGKIIVTFTHKLDINDLAKIKSDLLQKDIRLWYQKLSFDDTGKLTAIRFYAVSGKYSAGASNENVTDESKTGFYADRTPGAKYMMGAQDY